MNNKCLFKISFNRNFAFVILNRAVARFSKNRIKWKKSMKKALHTYRLPKLFYRYQLFFSFKNTQSKIQWNLIKTLTIFVFPSFWFYFKFFRFMHFHDVMKCYRVCKEQPVVYIVVLLSVANEKLSDKNETERKKLSVKNTNGQERMKISVSVLQ